MDRIWIVCVAIVGGTMTVHRSAQPMDTAKLLAMVDHLVYAGPDLRVATEKVEQLLGVKATPGGQHPGRGTRNALIALGASSYIEIIGPDPEQPAPSLARPFGIDGLREPKLVTWSAKEGDLPGRVKSASVRWCDVGRDRRGKPAAARRLLLRWTYTDPRIVVADGLAPFFINWGTTPHPAASAAGGVTLVGLKAEHPEA